MSMAIVGYISVVFAVQLLAVLVLISSTEALKCYSSIEICDTRSCSDKEAVEPTSHTFVRSDCGSREKSLLYGILAIALRPDFQSELNSLNQLETAEANATKAELEAVGRALSNKINGTEYYNEGRKQPLCSRTVVTFMAKFPTKTLQKTAVVTHCTIGNAGCEDIVEKSKSGNFELTFQTCRREGDNSNSGGARIVTCKLSSLAPLFVVGIAGLLARQTQLHHY